MLKQLELVGFKSFGKRTVLDFPKGITVVVGPNGSGKSNIIDALRWLLGEREAKNLRGAKVENLIFSGTSKKTRLGMAQATLHFDNSSGMLPVDFNEVAVTRRVYRDGNSDYLINKSQVRLKDVIDFFAKSKMGAKGLSIINQGNSDLFIRSSSKERREMMEEILGLRQYQIKKHEAELKLRNTEQNLEKSRVTVEELLPRLRLLRRQTNKWKKRAIFAEELQDLENNYFFLKIQSLKKASEDINAKIKELEQRLSQKREELIRLEEDVKKIESVSKQEDFLRQSASQQKRRFELQREVGRLEAELKFINSSSYNEVAANDLIKLLKEIRKELGKLHDNNNLSVIRSSLQGVNKKIDALLACDKSSSLANKENSKEKWIQKLEQVKKELLEVDKEEAKKQAYFEDFHNSFRQAFQLVSAKKDEIQQLESRKNQLLLENDRWRYGWQDLEDKIREAGREIIDFTKLNATIKALDFDRSERRMSRLRNELAAIGEIDEELVQEATATEKRYNFLSSQISDLEKASVNLTNLIQQLKHRVHFDFSRNLALVNKEFGEYFRAMFGEGKARLVSVGKTVEIDVNIPSKGVRNLDALSGGERSLISIAALFSLISISPPPFLVFDEIDAALDEKNSQRFINLLKKFASKTQFIIVTHNRSVMEAADVMYGVAMGEDGVSKILSLKLAP